MTNAAPPGGRGAGETIVKKLLADFDAAVGELAVAEPFLAALVVADRAAALAPYGRRQRFLATVAAVRSAGWPVLGGRSRWRLGEVTVAWEAVASSARG